jgi:hypothetical protein
MKVGDMVQANKFANWSARQAKFGFVLEVFGPGPGEFEWAESIQVLMPTNIAGHIKKLPASHFEVISES